MKKKQEAELEELVAPLGSGDDWLRLVREAEQPRANGRLGAYEIVDEIRSGGQGLIFRARQTSTGEEVALKRLATGVFSEPAERRRFEREIDLVSSLSHPGIVRVYGVEEVDGVALLAMEWVDGLHLHDWAARQPSDNHGLRRKLEVFLRVCEAVQYAHRSGVLHRDLKPSNILIDRAQQCRIVDFGLARQFGEADDVTRTLGFLGTPAYAAPERFTEDTAPLDVRSDVYSLGVCLFELLTGQRPFRAARLRELLADIEARTAPRPSSIRPTLGRALDTIVGRALAKLPDERYQTVHSLAEDLRRYLEGRPVLAMAPSSLYALWSWTRRHRVVAGLTATLILSSVAFGVVTFRQSLEIRRESNLAKLEGLRAEEERARAVAALAEAREEARKAHLLREFYTKTIHASAHPQAAHTERDAIRLLERAVENSEGLLANEPELHAQVLADLARTLSVDARPTDARRLGNRALEILEALPEPNLELRSLIHHALGEACSDMGDLSKGLEHLQEAIRILSSLPPSGREDGRLSSVSFSHGAALHRTGRLEAAAEAFRRAHEFATDRLLATEAAAALGQVLSEMAEFEEAETRLDEALRDAEELAGPASYQAINVCSSLGKLYREKGEPRAAIFYLRRSIEGWAEFLGQDNPRIAFEWLFLGSAYRDAGDRVQAIEAFDRVLALGTAPPASAHALRGKGQCHAALEQWDRSIECLSEACRRYAAVLDPRDPECVEGRIELFDTLVRAERLEAADAMLEELVRSVMTFAEFDRIVRAKWLELLLEGSEVFGYQQETRAAIREAATRLEAGPLAGSSRLGRVQSLLASGG